MDIPIQDRPSTTSSSQTNVHLHHWPPLRVDKRNIQCSESCQCRDPKRKKKRKLIIVLLLILLLYFFVNTIVLNVRVFSKADTSDDSYALSDAQKLCLTEFTVNAPANASLYPCSTCLSLLQDIPYSYKFSTADGYQTLSNALQFCGLQSLVTASGGTAQNALTNGGWVQDVDFCTWTGVQCDGQGRISSL